jgi:hypothetical protein
VPEQFDRPGVSQLERHRAGPITIREGDSFDVAVSSTEAGGLSSLVVDVRLRDEEYVMATTALGLGIGVLFIHVPGGVIGTAVGLLWGARRVRRLRDATTELHRLQPAASDSDRLVMNG